MLKKAELDEFKNLLQTLRARVRGDVQHLTADALDRNENGSESKSPTHLAELGTETYEQEFTLRRVENEQEVLEEIEEAFERINDETFGVCVSCREAGRPATRSMIPKTRLREIPYARNCVECERKREEHR
jgi:DnaK suppressor protein